MSTSPVPLREVQSELNDPRESLAAEAYGL